MVHSTCGLPGTRAPPNVRTRPLTVEDEMRGPQLGRSQEMPGMVNWSQAIVGRLSPGEAGTQHFLLLRVTTLGCLGRVYRCGMTWGVPGFDAMRSGTFPFPTL